MILLAGAIALTSINVFAQEELPESKRNKPEIVRLNKDEPLYTPNSSVLFAVEDLKLFPEDEQQYIRYLSLYNIPKKDRKAVAQTVSFVLNSLSTLKTEEVPVFVANSDETVLRVKIDYYNIKQKGWENLGLKGSGIKPRPDPYFHTTIIKQETPVIEKKEVRYENKTYYDQYGRPYTKQVAVEEETVVEQGETKEVKRQLAAAPWLDTVGITKLIKWAQSETPILRADWFIVNACLPPAYYDLLGLGDNVKDFEKFVFANPDLALKAHSVVKGVVVTSTVARNNRTLLRSPSFTGGYYWISHDTLKSIDERDYVQFVLNEQFDATEIIASLPNGLQVYFLTDGAGKRLDAANTDIALDNTAVDRTVRTGRSCMICHSEGIRPIDDEIRSATAEQALGAKIKLLIAKKEDKFVIRDLFQNDLDTIVKKDQEYYTEAVARVTRLQGMAKGLTPAENASHLLSIYDQYAEHLIRLEDVYREVAIPPQELEKYIALSTNEHILGLVRKPIRPLRRDQWEAGFSDLMISILMAQSGVDKPKDVEPPKVKPAKEEAKKDD